MLQFELLRDRGVLVLSPNGSLEKADFERALSGDRLVHCRERQADGTSGLREILSGLGEPGGDVRSSQICEGSSSRHRPHRRVTDSELLRIMTIVSKHLVSAEASNFLSIK
jgi:hypothetical protein